jgi:TolA-binding protein
LRKTQEDNEFRFQELEKGGGSCARRQQADEEERSRRAAPGQTAQGDAVARVIEATAGSRNGSLHHSSGK